MRLDVFMLADGANAAEGKLYIHGGAITRVTPPTLPSPPIMLSVVVRLLADEADPDQLSLPIAVTWLRPDGTTLIATEATAVTERPAEAMEGEDLGAVIIINALVAFDVAGRHEISFSFDGDPPVATRGLFVAPPVESSA
jgi:hypothetical protein